MCIEYRRRATAAIVPGTQPRDPAVLGVQSVLPSERLMSRTLAVMACEWEADHPPQDAAWIRCSGVPVDVLPAIGSS